MDYVIDQNKMRKPDLTAKVDGETDANFIIPDTASIEMLKNEKWQETMRRSFHNLQSVKDRVFGTIGIGEAINREEDSGRPVHKTDLTPTDITGITRQLMSDLVSDTQSDLLRWIEEHRSEILAKEADPAKELEAIKNLVTSLKTDAGNQLLADLRAEKLTHLAQLGLIQEIGELLFFRNTEVGKVIPASSKPLTLRLIFLRLWRAVQWVRDGGLDSLPDHRALSYAFDHEYVLLATYFDDLMTEDNNAAAAYADLKIILDDEKRSELANEIEEYRRISAKKDPEKE